MRLSLTVNNKWKMWIGFVHKSMAYFVLLLVVLLLFVFFVLFLLLLLLHVLSAETMSLQSLNLFRLISVFVIIHPLSLHPPTRTILAVTFPFCMCVFVLFLFTFYLFYHSYCSMSCKHHLSPFSYSHHFSVKPTQCYVLFLTAVYFCCKASSKKKMFKCLMSMFLSVRCYCCCSCHFSYNAK